MKCSCCQEEFVRSFLLNELFFSRAMRCFRCQRLFSPLTGACCVGCGRECAVEVCEDCQLWQEKMGFLLENQALFHYDEGFRQWIKQYKFTGDHRLRGAFSFELRQALRAERRLICPIPLSEERYFDRGFNQVTACLAAAEISFTELLVKEKHLPPQASKTRKERLRSIQPFAIKDEGMIRGSKLLLVDDVYTTGRTLFHAAELLYQKGAKSVKSLTFSR